MKEYKYRINGNEYAVSINEVCDTTAKVTVNGTEYDVEWEKPVEEKPIVKVQPVVAKPTAAPAPAAKPVAAAPAGGYSIKTPLPGVIIDGASHTSSKPNYMHTAIWGKNVVGKRFHDFSVAIVVLESNFNTDIANLLVDIKDIIRQNLFAVIEALDVALDATLEIE